MTDLPRYSEPIDVHHPDCTGRIGEVYQDRQTGCWIAALYDGTIYMDECDSYEDAHAELTFFFDQMILSKQEGEP